MNILPVLVFGNLSLKRDAFALGGPRMRLVIEGGEIHVNNVRYRYNGTDPRTFDRICTELVKAYGQGAGPSPSAPAGEDSEEKRLFREVARDLRPDITRDQFDHHWERFLVIKAKAEAMKAQGIAIHPTFGLQPHEGA